MKKIFKLLCLKYACKVFDSQAHFGEAAISPLELAHSFYDWVAGKQQEVKTK